MQTAWFVTWSTSSSRSRIIGKRFFLFRWTKRRHSLKCWMKFINYKYARVRYIFQPNWTVRLSGATESPQLHKYIIISCVSARNIGRMKKKRRNNTRARTIIRNAFNDCGAGVAIRCVSVSFVPSWFFFFIASIHPISFHSISFDVYILVCVLIIYYGFISFGAACSGIRSVRQFCSFIFDLWRNKNSYSIASKHVIKI